MMSYFDFFNLYFSNFTWKEMIFSGLNCFLGLLLYTQKICLLVSS